MRNRKEIKKRADLFRRTKILLKYYNEMFDDKLLEWGDVPEEKAKLIMEVGFVAIAKVYARRLKEKEKSIPTIATNTGLSLKTIRLM